MNTHQQVTLRLATMEDEDFLFTLRNDPEVRANSRRTEVITADDHHRWMTIMVLMNDDVQVYIVELNGVPVGQGRIERAWETVIGYSLVPSVRGHGFGCALVAQLVHLAKKGNAQRSVTCHIKRGNWPSLKVAVDAGVDRIELFG